MQDSFRGKGEGVHDDGFVVPSGTVTFLFTNVEGSTRLWDADADGMSASPRVHAVFISKPTGWCVQATDAPNGLFVNGTRVAPGAVHPLAPEDLIQLGERTTLVFHTLAPAADDRSSTQADRSVPKLTPGERRVLLSLCSPLLCGDTFTPPATVHAIAMGLVVSESAVKQQLSRLYAKFEVHEGPDRRLRLANEALRCGAVHVADLELLGEA